MVQEMADQTKKKGRRQMNISKFKIAWKYLCGGMGSVADYLLDILNKALKALDPAKKEKVIAVNNIAKRVLSALSALAWLCPTKWQTAYNLTVAAVKDVVDALEDLNITAEELTKVQTAFDAAVKVWKSDDDSTCVDGSYLEDLA